MSTSGAANANPYQFTGRENDDTGSYFYRARCYSPTYQRFIAQDPIGFGGRDPNLYAYVRAYKDLALACRLPTAGDGGSLAPKSKEIPDEMHTIRRLTRLERCEVDKNTGLRLA
ncbi:MAG: RHS repeat-associated core domain-containing protein [Candidatus Binataceae bacterium]